MKANKSFYIGLFKHISMINKNLYFGMYIKSLVCGLLLIMVGLSNADNGSNIAANKLSKINIHDYITI